MEKAIFSCDKCTGPTNTKSTQEIRSLICPEGSLRFKIADKYCYISNSIISRCGCSQTVVVRVKTNWIVQEAIAFAVGNKLFLSM